MKGPTSSCPVSYTQLSCFSHPAVLFLTYDGEEARHELLVGGDEGTHVLADGQVGQDSNHFDQHVLDLVDGVSGRL